jgi:membrane protease YdiL (CAAX protease family)
MATAAWAADMIAAGRRWHHRGVGVSRTRAALPTDWREFARSGLPLGLILLAAAIQPARPFVLAALVAGFIVATRREAPVRWAWAAPIPVAVALCWGLLTPPVADPGGADCPVLTSPPAIWRLAEGGLVLGVLAILATVLRVRATDLLLRWPRRQVVWWSIGGAIVLGPVGLLLGAALAQPFFGSFSLDLSNLGFLVPALVFALANGVSEELAYRGALMTWSARVTGSWTALVAQAVVFGLAHGGPDVGGSPIVLMGVLGVGGFVAGWIALRTRSLLLPIAWHVALDLPLYAYLACRAS